MKKIFTLMFIVVLTISSFAKSKETKLIEASKLNEQITEISGIVTDKISNEVLVGAEVKLDGTDIKTYTDFDGKYTFKNIKPGSYKLVTSYISYNKKISNKLRVKTQNKVDIQLEASK